MKHIFFLGCKVKHHEAISRITNDQKCFYFQMLLTRGYHKKNKIKKHRTDSDCEINTLSVMLLDSCAGREWITQFHPLNEKAKTE